jgi:hypothetical protein
LKSWAYAVSPHGLGLSEERSWSLTPREYSALREIHEQSLYRWALQQSAYYNVHFRGKGEPAWEPDHFLGKKLRSVKPRQSISEKLEVMRANQALLNITEEDVPAWAKGNKEDLCPAVLSAKSLS